MSDALLNGFFAAIRELMAVLSPNITISDIQLESFCAFCIVHFERSRSRVSRNHSVVSAEKEDLFKNQVKALLNVALGQFGVFKTGFQKFMTLFPRAAGWLH